jgi:hypothetical protein
MKIRFATILCLLCAFSTAPIQAASPVDFAPFSFLVGSWSCMTTETDTSTKTPSVTTWKVTGNGRWMVGKTDYGKPDKYDDEAQQRITYDAEAALWIYQDWRQAGGFNLYTTPGFTGDTAVWTNHSFVKTKTEGAISNYTMKKFGERKYVGTFSLTERNGTVIGVRDTCTKS